MLLLVNPLNNVLLRPMFVHFDTMSVTVILECILTVIEVWSGYGVMFLNCLPILKSFAEEP